MRGVEDRQARAGDLAADEFAGRDRRRHVMTPGDHQRRAFDFGQECALIQRAQGFAAGEIALHRRRDQHRLHIRCDLRLALAEVRGQPAGNHGVGHRRDAAFLHRLDAVVPVGRIGIVAGGVGKNDLAEPLRCVGAEPLSDHAAHRQSAPVHLLDVEVVEDRQHVAAESLHGIGAGRHAGLAMAAPVIADYPKKLGERLHLRLPHLQGAAKRIRQHQGRPAVTAVDGHVEQATVGIDHRHSMFLVIRGLDPRIHLEKNLPKRMDCRVKPGNDVFPSVSINFTFSRAKRAGGRSGLARRPDRPLARTVLPVCPRSNGR